jgi:ADP-ribose pyrophosphatase YjhB (NUDIX family)
MKPSRHQIRVTGVLIENGRLLLVRQKVTSNRRWSLPDGRVEAGESLETAMIREMKEETGLDVAVERLIYLAERPADCLLHITFAIRRTGGDLQLPTNEFDENHISDVRLVPVREWEDYGFSAMWREIVEAGFPGAPGYVGGKENIGL